MNKKGERWTIHKASDYNYEDIGIILSDTHFMNVLKGLHKQYQCSIIISFEYKTITIYDSPIE